jgi:hypothetical protein
MFLLSLSLSVSKFKPSFKKVYICLYVCIYSNDTTLDKKFRTCTGNGQATSQKITLEVAFRTVIFLIKKLAPNLEI